MGKSYATALPASSQVLLTRPVQQIFDIPKRKRETDVQHHCKADDFGAGFEVFEGGRCGHS